MCIFQVMYYSVDCYGDKTGEIWEVGYFDDRNKASSAVISDPDYENGEIIKSVCDTFDYAKWNMFVKGIETAKGFYELTKIELNKILNNHIAE